LRTTAPIQVIITNADFSNRGGEAMVRCVQRGIVDRLAPGSTAVVLSRGRSTPTPRQLMGLGVMKCPPTVARVCRAAVAQYLRRGAQVRAIIDISGYRYFDPGPHVALSLRTRAKRMGSQAIRTLSGGLADEQCLAPTSYYLPQAWGPFRTKQSYSTASRILRRASLVYARDEESLNWLRDLPGYDPAKVRIASDIAFTFQGAGDDVGHLLIRGAGLPDDESPLVGVVPNMRVYERTGTAVAENAYIVALAAVVQRMVDAHGARVLLMPHEILPAGSPRTDDRFLCRLLLEGTARPGRVGALLGEYSAEELKAAIGLVDLLISSRFHALIAALSLRRPAVCVSWSHKYHHLMADVGLGAYVTEHGSIGSGDLVALCNEAWNQRADLSAKLEGTVPACESSARGVLDTVVASIGRAYGVS